MALSKNSGDYHLSSDKNPTADDVDDLSAVEIKRSAKKPVSATSATKPASLTPVELVSLVDGLFDESGNRKNKGDSFGASKEFAAMLIERKQAEAR
jgi:hypothetical protein